MNYNTSDVLEKCIESINLFEKNTEKEIIIVDNKSGVDSINKLNLILGKNKDIRCIFLDSNKGFAYANNRGVEISSGDFILILNPDIVFTKSVLSGLTQLLSEKSTGAVGVKLYGEDGIFQKKYYHKYPKIIQYVLFYSIFSKPFINSQKLTGKYIEADINEEKSDLQEVPQIPGAFIFLKKEVYNEFKGFNESFFLFFEDVDFCYRISKKYKMYISDYKVNHIGASSMMMDTNYKIYALFIVSYVNFFRQNYSYLKYITIKSFVCLNSYMKILLENIRNLFGKYRPDIVKVHKYILENYNLRK